MLTRIKYKLKRIKISLGTAMKVDVRDVEVVKKMSAFERTKFYFKRIIKNPKKFIKSLIKQEFNINYIEIVLTTTCTLNCKGCSALMNYYSEPSHTNLQQNIEALKRVLSACDSINHLRLLGGEPLCYPNLYEMLVFINKQEKIKRATIVTNGTLLINDNRIIEILKNNKFDVYISNYGNASRKKEELINQLKENNIVYILSDVDRLWRDYGDLECRNRSEKELEKQFFKCKLTCKSIYKGKIYHCPRSTHGTNLKKVPLRERDYIDLMDKNIDEKTLRKLLYKFFYGYVPYTEACNYCNNGTNYLKSIPAGEQYKKA